MHGDHATGIEVTANRLEMGEQLINHFANFMSSRSEATL